MDLDDALTSVGQATPHVFPAGTESLENGDEWLALWQAAKREKPASVMELNWHQNAYCDTAWELDLLGNAITKHQQEGVMREAFRDPFAGFGTWCYPEARSLPDANQPYRGDEPLDLTIDPGPGDITAIMAAQATAIDGQEGFHVLWSLEREMPNPEWIAHILTGIWPQRGDACYGMQPDPRKRRSAASLRVLARGAGAALLHGPRRRPGPLQGLLLHHAARQDQGVAPARVRAHRRHQHRPARSRANPRPRADPEADLPAL
jgi:hypothetical protein